MFESIIVGVDGSEQSDAALRTACQIAKTYGSALHLVHTPQPTTVAFAMGAVAGYHAATTMPSEAEVKAAADKILTSAKAIAKEIGHPIAEVHSRKGSPAEELLSCADECNADLIVTGRRGLGSVGSLVLGSTSLAVAKGAKCAVLTVA
ncbi:universal stress protein [Pseudaestuariivita atlantica]|uniref:universal stress protein n=1 Tax=Pseudaestuariivita atlantica TaxID=1317121 RepID=UPI0009E3AB63|nr:universal stress protein [Pseudaestuariivita atlantica]